MRRNAPDADIGRGKGRVELKEGVEKMEEGGSCNCCDGFAGLGRGDGEVGRDILLLAGAH